MKNNIASNTGCNDWNNFIKNQLSLPFDYITFFKLTAYAETYDMTNNLLVSNSLVCSNEVAVKQIIDTLQTKSSTQEVRNVVCDSNLWSIKYCNLGYSICVNCISNLDLCSADYCPSLNNFLYTSPCSNCPHDAKSIKRISSYSLLDFQYRELILYPLISSTNVTSSKNGFKLGLNISNAGNVFCMAADSIVEVIKLNQLLIYNKVVSNM